jgi:uncharacterized protein (TIGR02145 family)
MKKLFILPIILLAIAGCKKTDNNSSQVQNNGIVFNPNIAYGTVTDIDNNTYKTVTIGNQTWMAENLKVTRYNVGVQIPLVIDNTLWSKLSTPGYCWYNNEATTYKAIYGALYNWYSVNTGKLAPIGWHVPTDTDWNILEKYLDSTADTNIIGGVGIDIGDKLKETGTNHWHIPNSVATNSSGFTALPGGYRANNDGRFQIISLDGFWWSSTVDHTHNPLDRTIYCTGSQIYRTVYTPTDGFSIRCVKD